MPDNQPMLFQHLPRPEGSWVPPSVLPNFSGVKKLWADTESDGLDPRKHKAIGQSYTTDDGFKIYLPTGHHGGGNLDEEMVRRWARSDDGLRGKTLCYLNAKHDYYMMYNYGVDLEALGCNLQDVSFKAALLDDNRQTSAGRKGLDLQSLALEYVASGKGKESLGVFVDKKRMVETHSSEIGAYAERDSSLVRLIDYATELQIKAQDLSEVLSLENSLIYCTAEMERNGLRLDRAKLAQWDWELQEEYAEIILYIYQQTGLRVNPDSPPEMFRLCQYLGVRSPEVTEKGEESYSAYAIEKINHPLLNRALRARRVASLRSKYIHKFLSQIGRDDTLYYSLHQLKGDEYGTVSGRYSGTNMSQQIMKVSRQRVKFGDDHIIREAVIPDDGFCTMTADAKQIEFRLFVHYSQSERLLDYYRRDPETDFHNITMDKLTGYSFMKLDPKPRRERAKKVNFSVVYGLSDEENAAKQLECELEEAVEILRDYHRDMPEVNRLLRGASNLAAKRGYVKTILNRRARFPHKQRLHSALNRVLQGTAAELNKIKLKIVYDNRKWLGVHKMRLTLHDEIMGDNDRDPIYKKRWQEKLDEQSIPLSVPILWEVNSGSNWAGCA
jgi:DNA polymerase-1